MDTPPQPHVPLAGKYLTFNLNSEDYGVQILKVREIIGLLPVTPLPHSADHILGVINLRGRVIPVVDMRRRFHMPPAENTEDTCIIVTELDQGTETRLTGILVDQVAEVFDFPESATSPAPQFGASIDSESLLGMGRLENQVVMLLDIESVLRDRTIEGSLDDAVLPSTST